MPAFPEPRNHRKAPVVSDGKNAKDRNDGRAARGDSHPSHSSHSSHPARPIIPPRGDYKTLLSFQKAEVVFDITFRFAHKYLDYRDRTIDQMIQSARSGKKNILEGSKAGVASKEMEIKLTCVGRASLEELLDDYGDYLRARDLRIWDKDSKEAQYIRRRGRENPRRTSSTASSSTRGLRKSSPTSPFASSTRPTTSSTSNSAAWKRTSSPPAACASG
jgi:hypothetical protein